MTDNRLQNRVFLYEVVMGEQGGQEQGNVPVRRSGRQFIRVPYRLMSQEMRRITQMGGKIISIRPIEDVDPAIAVPESPLLQQVDALSQSEAIAEPEVTLETELESNWQLEAIEEKEITPEPEPETQSNLAPEVIPEVEMTPEPQPVEQQEAPIESDEPWWVEIYTSQPRCLYYFGPFDSASEANYYKSGYIEDLQAEGAEGITTTIKQCRPINLTKEW
jgi:hypothetical protein